MLRDRTSPLFLALLAAALGLPAAAALAQELPPPGLGPVPNSGGVAGRSFGLGEVDGRIVGGGPDYRAEFDASGFAYTAAFGKSAPRTWPLHWTLASVARGDQAIGVSAASPQLGDGVVDYDRGGFIERYQARVDGIEQSFVFASKPEGSGDLVVRARIATDLARPAAGASADGLDFDAPGFGSISIGKVTGIDAAGRTVAGGLALDGDFVEYRLPATFVDGAAYPLVLDPLFSQGVVVATDFDEQEPDVSWDASTGHYLVVWDRQFASGDHDIRGQRIDPTWAFIGGTIFIESDGTINSIQPRVGDMNNCNRFIVVWTDSTGFLQGQIKCRAVSSSTGAVSAKVSVGPTSGFNLNPDVGCEAQEIYDKAIIVWQSIVPATLEFEVMAANVTVPLAGNPSVVTTVTLGTGFDDQEPAISSHDLFGNQMVVWKRAFPTGDTEIRGAVVDRNLTVVDSLVSITNTTAWESAPAVGGDGYNFLVAYETEPTEGSGDKDVVAMRVRAVGGSGQYLATGTPINLDVGVLNSEGADVSWMYGSALVVWRQEMLDGRYRGALASIDGVGSTTCENYFYDDSITAEVERVRVGGDLIDLAMIVYEWQPNDGSDAVITGQQFLAADGNHKYLSGPCGAMSYATCARAGNPNFGLRVTTGPANAAAYAIIGSQVINVPCGGCALVVNPSSGLFLAAGTTDANGELSMVTGIPNDPALKGLKFAAQWLLVAPTGPWNCPSLHAHLSNGLEVTIQ